MRPSTYQVVNSDCLAEGESVGTLHDDFVADHAVELIGGVTTVSAGVEPIWSALASGLAARGPLPAPPARRRYA